MQDWLVGVLATVWVRATVGAEAVHLPTLEEDFPGVAPFRPRLA
jgi:hypothetical protein